MAATWSWVLCDGGGSPLGELTTASGRNIAFKRNTFGEAQFTISHEDDAAALLLNTLKNSGIPQLKCYRRGPNDSAGVLRFRGYLAPFTEESEETSLLTPVFRGPFSRLMGDGTNRGRFTGASVIFTATDAGAIAKSLVDTTNADGDTGLATTGTIQTTKARDRTYQYANVGESIVALTNVLDGFDFEEVYVDAAGSPMAQLAIYAAQGTSRPSARFQYGTGTLANVRNVKRTTEPPINSVRVIGGNGRTSVKTDSASIAKYGLWPFLETLSTVLEQTTLDDHATSRLRPNPVKVITFTPDLGLDSCPKPWDDFWMGDTVGFYARRGALLEDVSLRVNGMTVAIDDNGIESSEIPDPTTPEQEATIMSDLSVEVL